jgi:hypothetical protein
MESGDEPMELKEARAAYFERWEAVEIFKAHELAAMTKEQAMAKILHCVCSPQPLQECLMAKGLLNDKQSSID